MTIAVHIINPGKKKSKAKKKTSTKKRSAKKRPAKKKTPRKKPATPKAKSSSKKRPKSRRKPSEGTDMAKKRKKSKAPAKRRKNPAPKKTKRRRKNPSMAGFGGIAIEIRNALPRLIGKVVCAWAVKQFGGISGERTSTMLGDSWNGRGYMIAAGVAIVAPPLLKRIVGGGSQFRQGVVDLIIEKAVWTEGFARSEWMKGAFGGYGQVAYDPNTGQSYVDQGNDQWSAMQGLVDRSALDGIVEKSALDGPTPYMYGNLTAAGARTGDSSSQHAHSVYA